MKTLFASLTLAACLVSSAPAFGAGKSVDEASETEKKDAGNKYATGMADFEKNDFDRALSEFRESYGVVKSPNSHFMIARTLARLGRNVEAYAELEAVVTEADALGSRYSETSEAARAKMEEVRPRVAFVVVTLAHAPKGTTVTVGDETLDGARLGKPWPVLPGETTVVAVTPDGARTPRKATVAAGDTATVDINLEPTSTPSAPPEPSYHPKYRVELEAFIAGETQSPPGYATRGAGPGGRVALELVPRGLLGSVDSFAIEAGTDWFGTSNHPHFWIPATLEWNFWVLQDLSIRLEPGVALMVGAGTHVGPALYAGVRYRIFRSLFVSGRIGIPEATLGASLLL